MSILFLGNQAHDFGGVFKSDTAFIAGFDSAYSDCAVTYTISIPAFSSNYSTGYPMFLNLKTTAASTMWFHCRFYSQNWGNATIAAGNWILFLDSAGNTLAGIVSAANSANNVYATAIGDTTVNGGTFAKVDGTPMTLDIQLTVGANITINVYSGGSLVSTATAANTGGKVMPSRIKFDHYNCFRTTNQSGVQSGVFAYSEIIVTDNENTIGWRLNSLKPNSAGSYHDWIGDFSKVSDYDPSTGCGTDTALNRNSWHPSTYAGPASPTSIRGLFLKANAQVAGTGPQKLGQFLRIGTTDYDGTDQTLSPGYQNIQEFANNPATAAPWTTADLSTFEFGIKSAA